MLMGCCYLDGEKIRALVIETRERILEGKIASFCVAVNIRGDMAKPMVSCTMYFCQAFFGTN